MAKRQWSRPPDLESLFLRLEELVLANSGEDEFEEIYKLLIAKLWDERSGQSPRFHPYDREIETFEAVRALLRAAEHAWPGIVGPDAGPRLTPEHLQVCVGALAQHSVSRTDLVVFDSFFEFLVAKAAKGAKGQYFTPRHVIELCVRMTAPTLDETVLDPACGSGGFLLHAMAYLAKSNALSSAALRHYCETKLWGFDISARAVRVAKALMLLAGDGRANILRLNSLLRPETGGLFPLTQHDASDEGGVLTIEDVCRARLRRHRGFDVILTNPPFAGEVRERQILDSYAISRGRSRAERDTLFLERCVELLRPGGRLAIVLPHNKLAGSALRDLRSWLLRHAKVLAVVGLGRNTFLPHTHQKAGVLLAQRRLETEREAPHEETFFAISEREGKNSKGQLVLRNDAADSQEAWDRVDHDLGDIVEAFRGFMQRERPVRAEG